MSVTVKNDKRALLKGINTLADAVGSTLGARGRVVPLERDFGEPHVTKDGVTVAESIVLEDRQENLGCSMLKASALRAAKDSGDGTTTTTVIARKLFSGALDLIEKEEVHPVVVKDGIDKGVKEVVSFLKRKSTPLDTDSNLLKDIITISANGDTNLGELISEAFQKVGANGIVNYKESVSSKSFVEIKEGLTFDNGWWSPYFINKPSKEEASYTNPKILIVEGNLEVMSASLAGVLKSVSEGGEPLIIIANKISVNVLETLVANHRNPNTPFSFLAIRAPYSGDARKAFLEDLAIFTGASVITDPSGVGFENFKLESLGSCGSITSGRFSTQILEGHGKQVDISKRVQDLKELSTIEEDNEEKKFINERISKLSKGVAFVNVGSNTTVELQEKMDRVEDAIKAAKAALEEGVVVGGGIILLRASQFLISELASVYAKEGNPLHYGIKLLADALTAPFEQILLNGGYNINLDPEGFMEKLITSPFNMGVDVTSLEIKDLVGEGIVDPTKVSRIAVEASTSVIGLLVISSCTIIRNINSKNN